MKKAINKFWGLLPFLIIIFCSIYCRREKEKKKKKKKKIVAVIEKVTDNTFRILPRNILICSGIISIGILLLWLNTRKKISAHRIFSFVLRIISVFLIGVVTLTGLFVMGIFTWSRTY